MSGAHGHGHIEAEGNNKRIALLISVLALFLALVETMAKGAQTNALSYNIEAANLWSFFQAKTIRQTVVRTAGETAKHHHYEVSSAAFQIAIVLASATVITGAIALTWLSIGLGVVGIIFAGIGLLAPHAVHLL